MLETRSVLSPAFHLTVKQQPRGENALSIEANGNSCSREKMVITLWTRPVNCLFSWSQIEFPKLTGVEGDGTEDRNVKTVCSKPTFISRATLQYSRNVGTPFRWTWVCLNFLDCFGSRRRGRNVDELRFDCERYSNESRNLSHKNPKALVESYVASWRIP